MASDRLDTLQAGRGFAALAVLLYHADGTLLLPKHLGKHIAPVFKAGDSGVAFFFVLSGFVILLAHEKDLGRPDLVFSFLWKRFRRLYPPLWIALLLLLPFYFLFPAFGGGQGVQRITTVIWAFLVSPVKTEYLIGPEWTLRHEVIFYLFFAALIWKPKVGAALISAWLLVSLCPTPKFTFPWSFLFTHYNLLFAFGMLASVAYSRHLSRWPI
jgi:exopolysaccharide production protein ExoZ